MMNMNLQKICRYPNTTPCMRWSQQNIDQSLFVPPFCFISETTLLKYTGKRTSDAVFLQSRSKQRCHTHRGTDSYGYDEEHN
jgi:hypothetical protein